MTEDDEPKRNDVGYGRPPAEHQFKPGQSGNPKGRPRGAKSLSGYVDALLDQKITVSDQNGARQITRRHALAMRLVEKAMSGDHKSIQFLTSHDAKKDSQELDPMLLDLSPSEQLMLDGLLKGSESE